MALIVSATVWAHRSASAPDYNAAHTVAFWFKRTGPLSPGVFVVGNGLFSQEDLVEGATNDVFPVAVGNGFNLGAATTLTNAVWYFVAARRTSADTWELWRGDETNAAVLVGTATHNISSRGAASYIVVGARSTSGSQANPNAQYHGLRMWTAALSGAEIEAERLFTNAQRTANLWAQVSFVADGNDTSGNSRDFTLAGTPSYTAGPRIDLVDPPGWAAITGYAPLADAVVLREFVSPAETIAALAFWGASTPGQAAGASAGSSTASAAGASGATGTASAAGAAAVAGIGAALSATAGASSGTATAAATGAATRAGAGDSAGAATVAGVGAALGIGAGASAGAGTATGVGATAAAGSGEGVAAGASTASATGAALGTGTGSSAGTSTATSTGAGLATSAGGSAGASAATGGGAALSGGAGLAAGVGSSLGVGAAWWAAAGLAAGTSTATGGGASITAGRGAGASAGTSTATGRSPTNAAGAAAGASTATATSSATAAATGSSAGAATVTGVGRVKPGDGRGSVALGLATTGGAALGLARAGGVALGLARAGGVALTITTTGLFTGPSVATGAATGTSTAAGGGAARWAAAGLAGGTSTAAGVGRSTGPAVVAAAILARTPIAYWKLDETSGVVAADSSGNGRDGAYTRVTLGGSFAPFVAPTFVDAASNAGYADCYSAGLAGAIPAGGMTMLVFGRVETLASKTALAINVNGANFAQLIMLSNGTPGLRYSAGALVNVSAATPLALNQWAQIAATIAAPGTARLYVNGAQVSTGALASAYTGTPAEILVGGSAFFGGTPWRDQLAHVAIFPTVLSAADIAAIYAASGL